MLRTLSMISLVYLLCSGLGILYLKKSLPNFCCRFAFLFGLMHWALINNHMTTTTLPWYIDPARITEPLLTDRDQQIIQHYTQGTGQLLDRPDGREWVINRFKENGPEMIQEINQLKPDLVVDLACGMNPYKYQITNIVGTDITAHPDVDWVCDFKQTPFRDSVADVILLMNGYAFHRRNWPVFLEIQRIARPGCRVYCRTANKPLRQQGIPDSLAHIKRLTQEFGFEFVRGLPRTATFTDANDTGTYFPNPEMRSSIGHPLRVRWVWTWRVPK